ncbi:glycosyl hydrolase [Actinopolymorpha singaporensis]|uniref:glycosyl hydrolase n=1 Tax=Actinopolymorpha singaporensis TaxID=117157 RepID=UPI0012FE3EC8|nr:glycosyl hydrolase [Actinopolymorpha singaporensis]
MTKRRFSRRSVLRGAAAVAAGAAASTVASPAGASTRPSVVEAAPVTDFLDSICVCAHMGQGVDDPARVADALTYTGIRNIRDSDNVSAAFVDGLISVHQRTGARFVIVRSGPDEAWLADQLEASRRLARAGALLALEGPNEPNNWAVTFGGDTSVWDKDFTPVARWQQELYRRTKADALLRRFPVFHSSEAGGSEPNNVGLQFLTIPDGAGTLMPAGTRYADFANVHNYICRKPAIIDNMAWENASPDFEDWIDGIYGEYGMTWREGFPGYTSAADRAALPKVSTETGWATQGTNSLTEEDQGRLLLALYLSQFARGYQHTFVYMLRDDPVQGYWGFVDHDYRPKRSGVYLHNLTSVLANGAGAAPGGGLAYSISDRAPTTHDLLLRRSDGDHFLVVWSERAIGSESVTVHLAGPPRQVEVYDPTSGTTPIHTLDAAKTVPVTLTNYDVRVLRVECAAASR